MSKNSQVLALRFSWLVGFPDVIIHSELAIRNRYPAYNKAKAGDAFLIAAFLDNLLYTPGSIPCYPTEPVPLERIACFYIQRVEKIGVYMSLLREIQDGATEDSVSLSALLRKTKLLAGRIGVKDIRSVGRARVGGV